MSPLTEINGKDTRVLPMYQGVEETLPDGKKYSFVSTPMGGIQQTEGQQQKSTSLEGEPALIVTKPEYTVLNPGDVVELADNARIEVTGNETNVTEQS